MNNNGNIKQNFIDALFSRDVYTHSVNDVQFRTRCPFCGDSDNQNTGHLYIRANVEDNFPMVYHCFKCSESGVVDGELVQLLDIADPDLLSSVKSLNKTSDNVKGNKFINGERLISFNYERPDVSTNDNKLIYIENRLGKKLSETDIDNMKIVTSLKDFIQINNIKEITMDNYSCRKLEDHYVGFLSFGSSYILFRDISGREKISWVKYPITKSSKQSRVFYSMSSSIDIYSKDSLVINMAEGVMDILSVYKNLGYSGENVMNIAVCGKHYQTILSILLQMGFVGSNITVNIFSDNDAEFNRKKNNTPTTVNWFSKVLERHKHLYGNINIYYNTINKDVGVPIDKISLKKYRL